MIIEHIGIEVDLPQVDHGGGRARGREGAGEGARDPSDEVASGRLVSLAGI